MEETSFGQGKTGLSRRRARIAVDRRLVERYPGVGPHYDRRSPCQDNRIGWLDPLRRSACIATARLAGSPVHSGRMADPSGSKGCQAERVERCAARENEDEGNLGQGLHRWSGTLSFFGPFLFPATHPIWSDNHKPLGHGFGPRGRSLRDRHVRRRRPCRGGRGRRYRRGCPCCATSGYRWCRD